MASIAVVITAQSALDQHLTAWIKTNPKLQKDKLGGLALFEAWLANPPDVDGKPQPKMKLPAAGDPLYTRALLAVENQIERKFYVGYRDYFSAGTFASINEEQFIGYLAHKVNTRDPAWTTLHVCTIKTSLLPPTLTALINRVLTTNGVCDAGYSNTSTMVGLIHAALTPAGAIFSVKSQFTKAMVARIPTVEQLALVGAGHNGNDVGAIRSAHCDNNEVLSKARPKYTLNPGAGDTRENQYYLWIELLAGFDKNQKQALAENGLWAGLDAERRAVERIAYVEFTAGAANTDFPVVKARLVYDYVNNRVYLTVHYDTPNNLEYLTFMGVNPYFLVENDSPTGTNDITK